MSGYPGIRASDEDRSRTAAALGEHYAAGRLTLEEFQERLDQAFAAKTLGELNRLMADLPRSDPGRLPERRAPGPVQVPSSEDQGPAGRDIWLLTCIFRVADDQTRGCEHRTPHWVVRG